MTQNLSFQDYLIGVNHRRIVKFPPDVFPEDVGLCKYGFLEVSMFLKPADSDVIVVMIGGLCDE